MHVYFDAGGKRLLRQITVLKTYLKSEVEKLNASISKHFTLGVNFYALTAYLNLFRSYLNS